MTNSVPVQLVLPEAERYNAFNGGAIATVTKELAASWLRRGVSPVVLTPRDRHEPYPVGKSVVLAKTGYLSTPERYWWALARRISGRYSSRARYVRAVLAGVAALDGSRIVVANDPELALKLARAVPRAAILLWIHNFPSPAEAELLAVMPNSVRVVTVSNAVRDKIVEDPRVPAPSVQVIHNGVNRELFHPRAGHPPADRIRVVCHGRIDPNKGQLLAARAVHALHERGYPQVDFSIIGSPTTFGFDDEVVAGYVRDLGGAMREAHGEFVGRVPPAEVAEILRASDIACILPTVPDPFPLTGLEALASGCAVVAVPLGGVKEMMGDAAFLAEPTVPSVTDALEALVSSSSLRAEYQARAIVRASEFTWDDAADKALALFEEIEGDHGRASS